MGQSHKRQKDVATNDADGPAAAQKAGGGRGNAARQERLQAALLGQDPATRRGALPYQDRLEQSFGASLAGIPVWFDGARALAGVGAKAATDGDAVVFADSNPDFETVAHEVAHLSQAQVGGGGSGVDRGGAAEQEAEQAAQAAARGETPRVEQGLDAAVHRAVENPQTFDPDTTDDWEYAHREADLGDGYSTGPNGVPQDQMAGDVADVAWEVDLVATKDAPLEFNGSPADDQLYRVVAEGDSCTGAGTPVTTRWGSVVDPNVVVRPHEEALYIGGAPTIDDITQGGIGDCFFLAAVSNITNQDPGRITRAVQPAGANVNVNLYSFNAGAWAPTTITTDRSLLQWRNKTDPTTDHDGLIGAGARVGNAPVGSEWYSEVENGILNIYRRDVYEMALWAPILEKAYARLAEKTNEMGGGPTRGTPNTGASGYERIEGGWEDEVYPIFYGPDMVTNRQDVTNYAPGQDLVTTNQTAIANLLRVMGEGGAANTHFMLSVDLDSDEAINRLIQLIAYSTGLPDARRYPSLVRIMGNVRDLALAVQAAAGDPAKETAAQERLAKACERQGAPGAWPLLESPRSDKIWHDLHDHLNIVAHLGTDASNDRRGTYADHAYPVLGATFVDKTGAPMTLTQANLQANLPNIDSGTSMVQLRNPHHGNEPNLPTSTPDGNTEDGLFSMNLDQYLRSFSLQQVGRAKDTP
jgi:Domain of unknown function (DUF4157)